MDIIQMRIDCHTSVLSPLSLPDPLSTTAPITAATSRISFLLDGSTIAKGFVFGLSPKKTSIISKNGQIEFIYWDILCIYFFLSCSLRLAPVCFRKLIAFIHCPLKWRILWYIQVRMRLNLSCEFLIHIACQFFEHFALCSNFSIEFQSISSSK